MLVFPLICVSLRVCGKAIINSQVCNVFHRKNIHSVNDNLKDLLIVIRLSREDLSTCYEPVYIAPVCVSKQFNVVTNIVKNLRRIVRNHGDQYKLQAIDSL